MSLKQEILIIVGLVVVTLVTAQALETGAIDLSYFRQVVLARS